MISYRYTRTEEFKCNSCRKKLRYQANSDSRSHRWYNGIMSEWIHAKARLSHQIKEDHSQYSKRPSMPPISPSPLHPPLYYLSYTSLASPHVDHSFQSNYPFPSSLQPLRFPSRSILWYLIYELALIHRAHAKGLTVRIIFYCEKTPETSSFAPPFPHSPISPARCACPFSVILQYFFAIGNVVYRCVQSFGQFSSRWSATSLWWLVCWLKLRRAANGSDGTRTSSPQWRDRTRLSTPISVSLVSHFACVAIWPTTFQPAEISPVFV